MKRTIQAHALLIALLTEGCFLAASCGNRQERNQEYQSDTTQTESASKPDNPATTTSGPTNTTASNTDSTGSTTTGSTAGSTAGSTTSGYSTTTTGGSTPATTAGSRLP